MKIKDIVEFEYFANLWRCVAGVGANSFAPTKASTAFFGMNMLKKLLPLLLVSTEPGAASAVDLSGAGGVRGTGAPSECVGWVERSDTHHFSTLAMGIATLNPSYDFFDPGVGANLPRRGSFTLCVFAHSLMFVRMNSHLQKPQLHFLG